MIQASHYVIKDILRVLEGGDLDRSRRVFEKFSKRYSNDDELKRIFDEFESYLKTGDDEKLKKIKSALRELTSIRKMETEGGTTLWFKCRRPGVSQLNRVT